MMVGFYLGQERYAIECTRIVEVVPRVTTRPIPHAPTYVTGMMEYRGQLLPVIDLCQIALGRACENHFSTRILLVNYRTPDGRSALLGLLAERVNEVVRCQVGAFCSTHIHNSAAPYLGRLAREEQGLLQCIDVDHLLHAEAVAMLFPQEAGV